MLLRSYAKINLGLRILRKRPDGFHEIETVFHPIDLFDELTLWQSDEDILFSSDNRDLPSDHTNLCVRAAMLLQELTESHLGVEIRLKKRIPVGAGLGGGSSNAATVLRGLLKLWNLDLSEQELLSISSHLGSDVPYFLLGKPSYATGRGEQLSIIPLVLPYWIVTATPTIQVSTVWAYNHCTPNEHPGKASLKESLVQNSGEPVLLDTLLNNDFESVVFPAFPAIESLRNSFRSLGACSAHLSGSGSSVFGLFSTEKAAKEAIRQLSLSNTISLTPPQFIPVSTD